MMDVNVMVRMTKMRTQDDDKHQEDDCLGRKCVEKGEGKKRKGCEIKQAMMILRMMMLMINGQKRGNRGDETKETCLL